MISARTKPPPDPLVGVEHEYEVFEAGVRRPFGELIHGLGIDGRRLDPGDPNAYRCSWGGVVTVDGKEAEIVTPPVALTPGFTTEASARAARGRRVLAGALGEGSTLVGYSTHLSVSVPTERAWAQARRFAARFAAPMMLLLDNRSSPGLLIRPRPSRLELGGDFVSGVHLRAALVMAAGAVLAVANEQPFSRGLPDRLGVQREMALIRPGLFVGRSAFGPDLYSLGRETPLGRRRRPAQVYLERAAEVAVSALGSRADAFDVAALERIVAGHVPLPCEIEADALDLDESFEVPPSPFAEVIRPRSRLDFSVTCVVATWDLTVFRLTGRRTAFVAIAGRSLASFLEALDQGAFDRRFAQFLASPPQGRVLTSTRDVEGISLFDTMASSGDLVAEEPRPPRGSGGSGGAADRSDKQQSAEQPRPSTSSRPRRVGKGVLVGGLAAIIVGAVAVAALNRPDEVVPVDVGPLPTVEPTVIEADANAPPTSLPATSLPATSLPAAVADSPTLDGDGEASLAFTQGVFTMTMSMSLFETSGRPGDTVGLQYSVASDGPSTAIDSATGVAILDCDPLPGPPIPPGRMDVALLPVADFPVGPDLDAAVAQVYELFLPTGATAVEGTISTDPLERTMTGCDMRIATRGVGTYVVPDIEPGDYWVVVPQNTITRPSPGEPSGQHSLPVPTEADAPLFTILPSTAPSTSSPPATEPLAAGYEFLGWSVETDAIDADDDPSRPPPDDLVPTGGTIQVCGADRLVYWAVYQGADSEVGVNGELTLPSGEVQLVQSSYPPGEGTMLFYWGYLDGPMDGADVGTYRAEIAVDFADNVVAEGTVNATC